MVKRVVLIIVLVVVVLTFLTQSGQGGFLKSWWDDVAGHGGAAVASALPKPNLPTIPAAPPAEHHDTPSDTTPGLLPADLPTNASDVVVDLNGIRETTVTAEPYTTDAFGPAITARPVSGCDTANLALARVLRTPTFADAPTNCVVASGVLLDPYTGMQLAVAGPTLTQAAVDPIVSAKWAWENGAATWTPALRQQFAGDLGNLTVVAATTARDRAGASPANWAPADGARRCELVTRFVEIAAHYQLSMPAGEKATLNRDLADCS